MSFFRRKQLDNTVEAAPAVQPPASETTINHFHASSRVGMILAGFVCFVVAAVLLWYALVFVIEQAGIERPQQAAATCLLGTGLVLALVVGLGLTAKLFLNDLLEHRERMAQKWIEMEQMRARTAQLIPPTTQARMTREESRKYQAVKVVMDKAYAGKLDDKGKLLGKVEPWSRREVGKLRLLTDKEEVGENSNLASWVKSYLLDKNILLSDRQVNIGDYPNLGSVETQLVKDFGAPILFNPPDDGGRGMSGQYIEKGTGRESWS